MSPRYRIVHFVPDPFAGGRVPIAAILESNSEVRVVHARHVPGADCLGGRRAYAALQLVLTSVGHTDEADRLPMGTGLHAHISESAPIPSDAGDPIAWLEATILPRRELSDGPRRARRSTRSKLGFQELRSRGLSKLVRKRFVPGVSAEKWLAGSNLNPISQWAFNGTDVLLMEPVIPSYRKIEHDAREIHTLFEAYHHAIGKAQRSTVGVQLTPHFASYVAPGASTRDLGFIRNVLSDGDVQVFNLASRSESDEFTKLVRTIGKPVDGQDTIDTIG